MIKRGLGGFEDNELRKILVRAGAIRSLQRWRGVVDAAGAYAGKDREEKKIKITDRNALHLQSGFQLHIFDRGHNYLLNNLNLKPLVIKQV